MVSEGVDVPRLRVGVYATSARTELFFRQVVGRFIRRTPRPKHQMSHVFLPSDPTLKRLAGQIEEERNHALVAKPEGEAVERGERGEPADPFHALSSSARRDDDVLQTTIAPGDAIETTLAKAGTPGSALWVRIAPTDARFLRLDTLPTPLDTEIALFGAACPADDSEAVARNERRDGKARVPKVAIFTAAKRLAPPQMEEGFDELHRFRVEEGQFVEIA